MDLVGANANVNKPVFGTQPPAPTNPGFGAFGQQQGQQQQQPGSGLFGGNSLFNNNQQSQLQPPSQPNQATSGCTYIILTLFTSELTEKNSVRERSTYPT